MRHQDSSSKELLQKFELLGLERRGITPSSYKAQEDNTTVDGDWELPSESNILELSQTSNGHSIQEFEEWKAKMREKEGLSKQNNNSENFNNEIRQPGMFDNLLSFNNNEQMNQTMRQQNSNPTDSVHRVDEMFFNQMNLQAAGFGQSSSRFTSFFNGSDNRGPQSSESSPQFEKREPQDADAIAFQRIMSMLNEGQETKQQSPEQQQQQQRATDLNSNNRIPEKSNDDAFFMSLLNKGGNVESKSPNGVGESGSNESAVEEPKNDTRISSATQSPIADVVRQPARESSFHSPHVTAGNFPFPPVPPEWMQKHMPGPPPMPMMGNMMPGLPFPPPGMMNGSGNQNSPPNIPPIPPNMMPPPPPMNGGMPVLPPLPPIMGMPPLPPGMFPMGVPPNGQFGGLPPMPPPGAMGHPMGMSENGPFHSLPPMPPPGSMVPPSSGMNMGGMPPGISNNERRVGPQ